MGWDDLFIDNMKWPIVRSWCLAEEAGAAESTFKGRAGSQWELWGQKGEGMGAA